mmetsp:Transcript_44745/g.104522  ORF Transcript_44745/g.104522 Transcript_44745/m.104522 type:complete len:108 (-) Transcript_44745:511-834(-)
MAALVPTTAAAPAALTPLPSTACAAPTLATSTLAAIATATALPTVLAAIASAATLPTVLATNASADNPAAVSPSAIPGYPLQQHLPSDSPRVQPHQRRRLLRRRTWL